MENPGFSLSLSFRTKDWIFTNREINLFCRVFKTVTWVMSDRWIFQALQKLNSSSELEKKRVNNGSGSCSEQQTFFHFLSSRSLCQGDFPFKLPLPCFLWPWDAVPFERPIPNTLERGWYFLYVPEVIYFTSGGTEPTWESMNKEKRYFSSLTCTSPL